MLNLSKGLHKQTHIRKRVHPPCPSRLRRLPFHGNLRPPVYPLQTGYRHVPSQASKHSSNPAISLRHDLQRRPHQYITRIFEHPVLPGQQGLHDTRRSVA
jgi:hypothetical protein